MHYILNSQGRKVFYIIYWIKKNAGQFKKVEEKVGDAKRNDMTAARAAAIRSRRMSGEEKSNREMRIEARKTAEWTIGRLWEEYRSQKGKPPDKPNYQIGTYADADYFAYAGHLKERFAKKHPSEISSIELGRFRNEKLKALSPQYVKHCLTLLVRLVRFGAKHKLVSLFDFQVEYPRFDNKVTNPLNAMHLKALIKTLAEYENAHARAVVLTALMTGLRRGSILRLKKSDLDFERGTIYLNRPKGTPTGAIETIPFPLPLQGILRGLPPNDSDYLFPGRGGDFMVDGKRHWIEIKKRAGLEGFRFHDLRHTFATLVAASGQVDIRELQRLLLHKSFEMTLRYSHLLDSRLQQASNTASNVILDLAKEDEGETVPRFGLLPALSPSDMKDKNFKPVRKGSGKTK
ncbi:MAG: site-specific integrase [Nitrospinae bacterium]|nr:site-specific integrase [Nitrospinota bacterium]